MTTIGPHWLDDGAKLVPNANGDDNALAEELLASWRPVDLSAAVAGQKLRPAPTLLEREDGRCLFYRAQVNGVHGGDGVGKSYVLLIATIQELEAGRAVVWLDFEDPDEVTIISRLRDFGVPGETILDRFHYVHPETEATPAAIAEVCDLVRMTGAELAVIDSVGEAFGLDGVNEDRDNEVAPWIRRVARPLAGTGAAVGLIDHGVKNPDNALHPSGSKRKRAAVTGASYLVEAVRTLSKEYGGGQLMLTTAKDRHGNFTRGKPAALIDIGSYDDGGMTAHVRAPAIAEAASQSRNDLVVAKAAVVAVKELCEQMDRPPSMAVVEERMKVKARAQAKRAAVDLAVGLGALREDVGPRRSRVFTYLRDIDLEADAQ